jgi:hypothetical protein
VKKGSQQFFINFISFTKSFNGTAFEKNQSFHLREKLNKITEVNKTIERKENI